MRYLEALTTRDSLSMLYVPAFADLEIRVQDSNRRHITFLNKSADQELDVVYIPRSAMRD